MRVQVSACGVTLALVLAGCMGAPAPGPPTPDVAPSEELVERRVGWIVFDSANDGCECARTVHTTRGWSATFEGASEWDHKAYFEGEIPNGTPLVLRFATVDPESHVWVDVELRYAVPELGLQLKCADDGRIIHDPEDARFEARIVAEPALCEFHLDFREPPVGENGIHLVWSAWTAGPAQPDGSAAGGRPMRFEARSIHT